MIYLGPFFFVFLSKKINIFEGTLDRTSWPCVCVSLSGCLDLEYFAYLLLCLVAFSLLKVRNVCGSMSK